MSSAAPFFSVILPTYNRAAFLPKAIESVLGQTFTNWELIVIDDGSTDDTAEAVKRYADPRIRYHYQQNSERSAARNKGIELSEGNFICFLDSDDYYLEDHMETLHENIRKRSFMEALYYCGICFEKNGVVEKREEIERGNDPAADFLLKATIGTPQACIHRNILMKHRFDSRFNLGEDLELWLRISSGFPLVFCNQYTVVATDHEDRSVNPLSRNLAEKTLSLYTYIFTPPHPGASASEEIRTSLISNCYFKEGLYYMNRKERLKAFGKLCRSIYTAPSHPQTKHKLYLMLCLLPFSGLFLKKISRR